MLSPLTLEPTKATKYGRGMESKITFSNRGFPNARQRQKDLQSALSENAVLKAALKVVEKPKPVAKPAKRYTSQGEYFKSMGWHVPACHVIE